MESTYRSRRSATAKVLIGLFGCLLALVAMLFLLDHQSSKLVYLGRSLLSGKSISIEHCFAVDGLWFKEEMDVFNQSKAQIKVINRGEYIFVDGIISPPINYSGMWKMWDFDYAYTAEFNNGKLQRLITENRIGDNLLDATLDFPGCPDCPFPEQGISSFAEVLNNRLMIHYIYKTKPTFELIRHIIEDYQTSKKYLVFDHNKKIDVLDQFRRDPDSVAPMSE